MPDITMCNNHTCKVRLKCYRYTATPGKWQSYFQTPPGKDSTCPEYWPNRYPIAKCSICGKPCHRKRKPTKTCSKECWQEQISRTQQNRTRSPEELIATRLGHKKRVERNRLRAEQGKMGRSKV